MGKKTGFSVSGLTLRKCKSVPKSVPGLRNLTNFFVEERAGLAIKQGGQYSSIRTLPPGGRVNSRKNVPEGR